MVFHCHVSGPEKFHTPFLQLVVLNEDHQFRPQRCKEQQDVLERENQTLKQAPGVKGYVQLGGSPTDVWNASMDHQANLTVYNRLGYAQKRLKQRSDLNETLSLAFGIKLTKLKGGWRRFFGFVFLTRRPLKRLKTGGSSWLKTLKCWRSLALDHFSNILQLDSVNHLLNKKDLSLKKTKNNSLQLKSP